MCNVVIFVNSWCNILRNLGTLKPLGHKDFYPNGGGLMPGCLLDPYDEMEELVGPFDPTPYVGKDLVFTLAYRFRILSWNVLFFFRPDSILQSLASCAVLPRIHQWMHVLLLPALQWSLRPSCKNSPHPMHDMHRILLLHVNCVVIARRHV